MWKFTGACFRYLWYILRHKYFVLIECWKEHLIWRGITHDLSKFRPSEFFNYAMHFYGKDLGLDSDSVLSRFNCSWLRHIHRNPHHWQHYILVEVKGDLGVNTNIQPMSYDDTLEMICDWKAMSRAFNNEVVDWYTKNKHKILLHTMTRRWVHAKLGLAMPTVETHVKCASYQSVPARRRAQKMPGDKHVTVDFQQAEERTPRDAYIEDLLNGAPEEVRKEVMKHWDGQGDVLKFPPDGAPIEAWTPLQKEVHSYVMQFINDGYG